MIKYHVPYYGAGLAEIQKVEVERETDACVWVRGLRRSKHRHYFDTWDEAHGALLKDAKHSVTEACRNLGRSEFYLKKITELKP